MNTATVVLGLDVSTTATKAILIAPDGSVVGVASSEYDFEIAQAALGRAGSGAVVDRGAGGHRSRAARDRHAG